MALIEKIYEASETYTDYDTYLRTSEFGGIEDTIAPDLTTDDLSSEDFSVLFDLPSNTNMVVGVDDITLEVYYGVPTEVPSTVAEDYNLLSCCIGKNSLFIVVGGRGTIIVSSNRGATWSKIETDITTALRNVQLFSDGSYKIVGDAGVLLTSTDGYLWKREDVVSLRDLMAVSKGGAIVGDGIVARINKISNNFELASIT